MILRLMNVKPRMFRTTLGVLGASAVLVGFVLWATPITLLLLMGNAQALFTIAVGEAIVLVPLIVALSYLHIIRKSQP